MSSLVAKAATQGELLEALYGEVTIKELQETDLGVLTPHRGDQKVVFTPLLPPRTQSRMAGVLRKFRPTRNTGGLLFVEKVVVVFTPHVPDDAPGEVEVWIHDSLLPNLNSIGQRLRFPLNGGPRLMAFYPPYSIPLADKSKEMPRCFAIVSELLSGNYVNGGSPFSLHIMWQPQIESVAHNYLARAPQVQRICRGMVRDALASLTSRRSYIAGAMSQRFTPTAEGPQPISGDTSCLLGEGSSGGLQIGAHDPLRPTRR
nr:cell-to-cell movement protein [Ethiopian tobacco bushy top virus]